MFNFRNRTRKENIIFIALGIGIIVAAIFLITSKSKQNNLKAYLSTNVIGQWTETPNSTSTTPTKTHLNEELKFSLRVPEDWIVTERDKTTIYTHEKSKSYFKIEVLDYNPSVNNSSASVVSTALAQNGYSFISYNRFAVNAYQVLYQEQSGLVNDYVETVYWDRDNIVKLSCCFLDADYKGIMPYFSDILGSFKWNSDNAIPKGYAIYYNPNVNFEMLVPEDWAFQNSPSEIRIVDPKTSATISMSVNPNTNYLDKITAADITNLIGRNKMNFLMQTYETSRTKTKAICSYTDSNKHINSHQYIMANGKYYYFISFNYYDGTLKEDVINTCIESYREFVSTKK